jgi:hypothetical protein
MKTKIIGSSGGYGGCFYDLDTVPRTGEVLNLGDWQGTVEQVIHIPTKFRADGCSAHIKLADGSVHQIRGQ